MTPLLLLLLALGPGATGRDPAGNAEPVSALEALLSSGSGSLPHGAVESLVGIAAGRAQCHAGPCGKCRLSADAVLALAGKAGAGARLEAAELPWLGAAVLVTLWDPPAACAGDASGRWDARVRALHRAFAANGTGSGSGSGGPGLWEVSELLAAVQPNYRSADSREACVDAAGVLAAGAAASPRVGAGRVLATLGALVLRGRCLRPPPPPGFFLGRVFGHGPHGRSLAGLGPGEQQHPQGPHGDPPHGAGHPTALPHTRIQSRPWDTRHGPTAAGPTAAGPNATGPVATSPGPTATGQLSTVETYALGTAAGLVLALCPLLALALLRCPLCRRGRRHLHPLLLGLAAGALSGDALLHLLPQVLGVHGHGEGTPGHEPPGHGEGAPEQPWKVLGVLGGLFAFFLLEKLLGILLPHREEVKVEDTDLTQSTQELQSQGRLPLPSLLALGRAAHALTDGLALGAAFATSGSAGLGAGLALLCHELPHALGAAAVLERAGRGRALALAAAGAVPVLPGLYAGIALGGAAPARAWMGAPAAGLLLHLGLCHAVPAMLAARDGHPWVLLGLQSAGLLGGWGVLLLLALYEDKLLR